MQELLDIIDYTGKTVGFADRDTVHKLGLRHKEITVIGVLPDNKIVFQKRSMSKKINPGGVVTFVGGHVSKDEDIKNAAIKEIQEESGLVIDESLLRFVGIENYYQKHSTGLIDNANLYIFTYPIDSIEQLIPEENEVDSFIAYDLDQITNRCLKRSV
jgi:isopentenyl-diphosphate Delta-isomerase